MKKSGKSLPLAKGTTTRRQSETSKQASLGQKKSIKAEERLDTCIAGMKEGKASEASINLKQITVSETWAPQ